MGDSPLRLTFLAEDPSNDYNGITVPDCDASDGWVLALPLTTIYSRMYFERPRQVQLSPSNSDGYLSQRDLARLTKACQATSKDLQERLSISSDSSEPSEMYDPFRSSGSDTSFEDPLTRVPSEADLAAMQEEDKTWDLYWTPVKESSLQSRVDPYRTPLRTLDPNLSPYNHNFASSNLSSLNDSEGSRDLRKSDVLREPRQLNHSSPTPLPLLPRTTYSPSPPYYISTPNAPSPSPSIHSTHRSYAQTTHHPTDLQHTQHQSWPTHTSSTEPKTGLPLRSRANTAPGTPSKFTPNHTSNLSTCTTIDYQSHATSNASSSPLYMHTAPPSPLFFDPKMARDFEMGNEISVWEDDEEDDDKEDEKGLVESLKNKLHMRSSSVQNADETSAFGVDARQEKKRTRRSLSEVVKNVFRARKKGGTL